MLGVQFAAYLNAMGEDDPAMIRRRERLAAEQDRLERAAALAAQHEALAIQHASLGCAGTHEDLAILYRNAESCHRSAARIFRMTAEHQAARIERLK